MSGVAASTAPPARRRPVLALILAAFVLVSLAYSVVNPLHEATDELRHYRFVRYLATRRALPVQAEEGCRTQAHHPPLYYAAAALATGWIETGRPICSEPTTNPFWAYRYWDVGADNKNLYLHGADEAFPWRGEALAAHLARSVNVLFGAITVWLTWAIAAAIWPDRPWLAAGAAAFVAFNPMFAFMAGAINNDIVAAASGAAVTLAAVRLLQDPAGLSRRHGVTLGILYGVALLSKFNLAVMALTIEAAVTWTAWRRRQWRQWWEVNGLISLATLLLAGWWFARNQLLYGEPTGVQRLTELWGVRNPADSWGVAIYELPTVWTTLWGRFGYGQVPLPAAVYRGLWWLTLLALGGLLLPARADGEAARNTRAPRLLLAGNVVLFAAVIFNYLLISPAAPMGRFFFPALPSLATLMFYGLSRWWALWPRARRPGGAAPLAAAANLGMLALALVALFGYLAPAYARPPSFAADAAVPNPVDAQFDTLVRLRGYQVSQRQVQPGGWLDLSLYWEVTGAPPGNFLLFVHLLDDAGMVAQRDTHAGLGDFPSSQWQVGDRFVESIRLYVPETAYVPAQPRLQIGWYAPVEGYRLAVTGPDGAGLGDALSLGAVDLVAPSGSALPNPQRQNFNNEVMLVGYDYSHRLPVAGEPLTVRIYWQALRGGLPDYRIEVHLRRPSGEPWDTLMRADARPQPPTGAWEAGQLVMSEHVLDTGVPPGPYVIHVALVDTATGAAQNLVASDGHWLDNQLLLAPLTVRP